jgi:hypothetical protein
MSARRRHHQRAAGLAGPQGRWARLDLQAQHQLGRRMPWRSQPNGAFIAFWSTSAEVRAITTASASRQRRYVLHETALFCASRRFWSDARRYCPPSSARPALGAPGTRYSDDEREIVIIHQVVDRTTNATGLSWSLGRNCANSMLATDSHLMADRRFLSQARHCDSNDARGFRAFPPRASIWT